MTGYPLFIYILIDLFLVNSAF